MTQFPALAPLWPLVSHRLEQEFGRKILSSSDPHDWVSPVETIAMAGSPLPWLIGMPGLPRGHILELLGAEQSGKSTMALSLIASAQASGSTVALIDVEHQLDVEYALSLGVAGEDLLLSHPAHAEQALGIAEALVRSNAVDLVVVDSVAALVPQADLATPLGVEPPGGIALTLLRCMQRLKQKIARSRCCLVLVDQLRERHEFPFGYPETTLSSRILNPFTAIRLLLRTPTATGNEREERPFAAVVSVPKNRLGIVGRRAEINWNLVRSAGDAAVAKCTHGCAFATRLES